MAVGPLRALLTAHLQASTQRSLRELGRSGAWIWAVLGAVLGLLASLPIWVGSGAAGYFLGAKLHQPVAAAALGLFATALSWGAAIVLGLLGGGRTLSREGLRHLPLSPFRFFLCELLAHLGDVWTLSTGVALTLLCSGVAFARPELMAYVFITWLSLVAGLLVMQSLVTGLAGVLVRRLRVALFLLVVLAWVGSALSPGILKWMNPPSNDVSRSTSVGSQRAARMERVRSAGRTLVEAARWTPGGSATRALSSAQRGQRAEALRGLLYPWGFVLFVGAIAYGLSQRERPLGKAEVERGQAEQRWHFKTRTGGVAWVYWRALMGSMAGRVGFLLPLVALVLLKGPLSGMQTGNAWLIPGAFAYATLGGTAFQLNQFGLDGHGIKAMLLLPLNGEELLEGKARAIWAYQGLQALLLGGLLLVMGPLRMDELLAGLCVSACLCIVQNSLGQWTSLWAPRRIQARSFSNKHLSPAVSVVSLVSTLFELALFGGLYLGLRTFAPVLLLPVMAGVTALCYLLNVRLRPLAAAYLDRRREALVLALG